MQAMRKDNVGVRADDHDKLKHWNDLPLDPIGNIAATIAKAYDKPKQDVMEHLEK